MHLTAPFGRPALALAPSRRRGRSRQAQGAPQELVQVADRYADKVRLIARPYPRLVGAAAAASTIGSGPGRGRPAGPPGLPRRLHRSWAPPGRLAQAPQALD